MEYLLEAGSTPIKLSTVSSKIAMQLGPRGHLIARGTRQICLEASLACTPILFRVLLVVMKKILKNVQPQPLPTTLTQCPLQHRLRNLGFKTCFILTFGTQREHLSFEYILSILQVLYQVPGKDTISFPNGLRVQFKGQRVQNQEVQLCDKHSSGLHSFQGDINAVEIRLPSIIGRAIFPELGLLDINPTRSRKSFSTSQILKKKKKFIFETHVSYRYYLHW